MHKLIDHLLSDHGRLIRVHHFIYEFFQPIFAKTAMDVAREKVSRKEVLMPQAFERNILELRCRLDPALLCFTRFELPNRTQDRTTTSMKSFGNFMYEIFTGFSLASGYQTRDYFEDMIRAI